jgi:hypothetical protein
MILIAASSFKDARQDAKSMPRKSCDKGLSQEFLHPLAPNPAPKAITNTTQIAFKLITIKKKRKWGHVTDRSQEPET